MKPKMVVGLWGESKPLVVASEAEKVWAMGLPNFRDIQEPPPPMSMWANKSYVYHRLKNIAWYSRVVGLPDFFSPSWQSEWA